MAAIRRGEVAVLILLFLLTACSTSGHPQSAPALSPLSPVASPTPGPLTLTLIHSNDTWGYVDPCG